MKNEIPIRQDTELVGVDSVVNTLPPEEQEALLLQGNFINKYMYICLQCNFTGKYVYMYIWTCAQ